MAAQVPAGEQRAEPVRHGRHRLGRPLGKALGEAGQDGLRHAGALLHVDHLVAVGRVHLLRVHGRHGDLVVVPLEVLVELVQALLRNVDGLLAEPVMLLGLRVRLEDLLGGALRLQLPRLPLVRFRLDCSALFRVGVFDDGGAPSFPVEVLN